MRLRWLALVLSALWLLGVLVVTLSTSVTVGYGLLFAGLGVVATLALVAMAGVLVQLGGPEPRIGRRRPPALQARAAARSGGDDATKAVKNELSRTFRQVEALQNLYSIIDIKHALPASRGWPASPDLLLMLVDLVDRKRPRLVVECGSGLSTLCFALAMRRFGIDGKVVALEHLEPYAEQTRELLARHGVEDLAEVRFAPLEPVQVNDVSVDWYAPAAWKDLDDVGILFVDGPPSKLSPHSRYPSMPFFFDRLSPQGAVVLDDYQRTKEQDVVRRWQAEYKDRVELEKIPLEKGAALLTKV